MKNLNYISILIALVIGLSCKNEITIYYPDAAKNDILKIKWSESEHETIFIRFEN